MHVIRTNSIETIALAALLLGCSTTSAPAPAPEARATTTAAAAVSGTAAVGQPAPDFTLTDYDGKPVRLADYRGKVVVLEWFNPDCPFVKASHGKGSLKGAAKAHSAKGIVWLAIDSSAPGKQGHDKERVEAGRKAFGMEHPILQDERGDVGRAYGAKRTPHMYVIDGEGVLVYRGAIDNSPDGEGDSPTGGTLVRYVDAAVDAVHAGKPVATAETEAYGCSVKY